MKLSNSDKFEIEKVMDIQVGWLTDRLSKLCDVATNMCAMKRDTKDIDEVIKGVAEARSVYREISKKFEAERLNTN